MKKYRQRNDAQSALIRDMEGLIDSDELFGRSAPLRLEIGFGHGRFLSAMAAAHPDENFIGVEAQSIRVTKTAHWSNKLGAQNVRLFAGEAHEFVRNCIPAQSLHRVYILFPDPWPKARHRRRRLVNRSFLRDLAAAMAPGGRFIFASDTANYCFQALSVASTLPGLFTNKYISSGGYAVNPYHRFPTVFEEHKKAEGCSTHEIHLVRTECAPPAPLPWAGESRPRQ